MRSIVTLPNKLCGGCQLHVPSSAQTMPHGQPVPPGAQLV